MGEVAAIMNSRPLTPIYADPEAPATRTPSMILTQEFDLLSPPSVELDLKDLLPTRTTGKVQVPRRFLLEKMAPRILAQALSKKKMNERDSELAILLFSRTHKLLRLNGKLESPLRRAMQRQQI